MSGAESALKKRSPPKVLLFSIFTFGLYWLYYVHQLNKQFKNFLDANYSATWRTIKYMIPIVNIFTAWGIGKTAHEVNEEISSGLATIGLLIPLIGIFTIQPKINEMITESN